MKRKNIGHLANITVKCIYIYIFLCNHTLQRHLHESNLILITLFGDNNGNGPLNRGTGIRICRLYTTQNPKTTEACMHFFLIRESS